MTGAAPRRRRIVPEVIQASDMDCGPAALASLLLGHGLAADYAGLRGACQTDVDGTSIDTIEDVARQLGLEAEQVMVPADHVLRPEAALLPALAVVVLPGGLTHFVVVWRSHGRAVQVMDPARGRQFMRAALLAGRLYGHVHPVPADDWREWAATDEFQAPLRGRLADLGVSDPATGDFTGTALDDTSWRGIAALDAAIRLGTALVGAGGVRPGAECARLLAALWRRAREDVRVIAERHWSVVPAGEETLLLRGAVLLRVKGRLDPNVQDTAPPPKTSLATVTTARPGLAARLAPFLRTVPRATKVVLAAAAAGAAAAVAVEAVLLNALLHAGLIRLARFDQLRLVASVGGCALFILGLDAVSAVAAFRAGRRLETDFRTALLSKLPRIADRHLSTWLRSDLAERAHAIALLRHLPWLALGGIRAAVEIAVTAVAIAVVYRGSGAAVAGAAIVALAVPLAAQAMLGERDGRLRALEGALSRHYLDALAGATAARAHAAEPLLRHEHAARLRDWESAGLRLQRGLVVTDAVQSVGALACAALVIAPVALSPGAAAGTLLLVFWALRLPAAGAALAGVVEQAVALRSTLRRLMEPLHAPEEAAGGGLPAVPRGQGCALALRNVSVVAGGHAVLHDVDLEIAAGEHVAVIGASGAGKSTLLGLFLGWHAPATGCRMVEGQPLEGDALTWLRARTAWLDPAVRLWNRSLAENVLASAEHCSTAGAMRDAGLQPLVDALPEGMETGLGEEGRLLSGGEGQKVRTARAFGRPGAALAVLDEPFRGLERNDRRLLLERARERWQHATLLCATHDLEDTAGFDRVLILEDGRVVEDGTPDLLRARPSRYAALLAESAALAKDAWGGAEWRRVRLDDGLLEPTA